MRRSRVVLLVCSLSVVLFLLASGAALKAGVGEGTFKQMLTFSEVLSYAIDNYVDPVDTEKLMHGAYEGLMGGLDAHSAYLTADEVTEWNKTPAAADHADPGMTVLKTGPVLQVVAVAPGSPADTAKIAVGDQLRKIDGHSIRQLSLDQALRLLRGAPGSTVEVELLRTKDFTREMLKLDRALRSDPPYVLEINDKIAVLKVRDLDRIPNDGLLSDIAGLKEKGVDRILVDLRDVASTDTRRAATVADLFVAGDVLRLKDRSGRAIETLAAKGKPAWSGRVAVLVNGATAGAGEGLAVILQERRKAPVYGEGTFGLGTEPKLIALPEGGGLLVPGYVWETMVGKRWNADGVTPDKVVKSDSRSDGDDEQLRNTLEDFGKPESPEAAPKAA
ncbi:MAG TPA: S41 family peptidase [Candidatus Polarisedimenticolaceae bacterium]|nr:S41 family peptidase [Candidatus Polarisedimenticolaceae bacterium]